MPSVPPTPSSDPDNRLTGHLVWPDPAPLVYPAGTIESYEERQATISRLARQWVERNPDLVTLNPARPKLRGATLAAQNIRLLFKRAYPHQVPPPRVTTDKHSNGSNVTVEWVDWRSPESPQAPQVRDALSLFETGTFNGSTDEFVYDMDLMREAFRKAFGSTSNVSTQSRPGSPEERVVFEQRVLRAEMSATAPDATVSPESRRPRRSRL